MPKQCMRRKRTMRGGFLNDFSNRVSNWSNSLYSGVSNMWNKTKSSTANLSSQPSTGYVPPSTGYFPPTNNNYIRGGKIRTRKMKGGYNANTPTTGLVAESAPFSGPTAQPHNWVGGKTRKRKGNRKSRRHRRRYN